MFIDPKLVPEVNTTNYPEGFKKLVAGRSKKKLGNFAQIKNFGVNLVTLNPGSWSSVRHWHSQQDEFVYILEGEVTLVTDAGEEILKPGDCAGFPSGEPNGHHLINHSNSLVLYLEIGDRTAGDIVTYPDADLLAKESQGKWLFTHKDNSPYDL